MKISKTHQRFADQLNNQRALSHPDEFLGTNWKEVLNFWLYLDTLSDEQLNIVRGPYNASHYPVDLWISVVDSSDETIGCNNSTEAFYAGSWYANRAGCATLELIVAHKILKQGKSLPCVEMFLNL
jgi:hypothetical protein